MQMADLRGGNKAYVTIKDSRGVKRLPCQCHKLETLGSTPISATNVEDYMDEEPPLQSEQDSVHSAPGDKPPGRCCIGDRVIRVPRKIRYLDLAVCSVPPFVRAWDFAIPFALMATRNNDRL